MMGNYYAGQKQKASWYKKKQNKNTQIHSAEDES